MLHRLVKVWCGGKSFFVEDGAPSTDGKRMWLPLSDPTFEWEHLLGMGEHESAHIRFSNFRLYRESADKLSEIHKTSPTLTSLVLNMFEDYRVEKLMPKLFAGSKIHFEDLYKFFRAKRPEPEGELQERFFEAIDTLKGEANDSVTLKCKKFIDEYMTFSAVVKAASIFLEGLPKEGKLPRMEDMRPTKGLPSDAKSRLTSRAAVEKVLEGEAKKAEESKESRKTEEEGEGEGRDGEEKESPKGGRGKPEGKGSEVGISLSPGEKRALDREKKKLEKAIEEERRKLADEKTVEKAEKKDITSFEAFTKKLEDSETRDRMIIRHVFVKDEDKLQSVNYTRIHIGEFRYSSIITKNAGLIQRLNAQLAQIRASKVKVYAKSGRLNISRAIYQLSSQKRGSSLMFEREVPTHGVDVLLLVDQSGSMSGKKIEIAREALIVFAEAMKTIPNVNFAVFGFGSKDIYPRGCRPIQNNYTMQYKDFSELSLRSLQRIAIMGSLNGNRDGFHFRVVADILKRKGKISNKKVLVIISDGEPWDNPTSYRGEVAFEDTKKALNEIKQQGVKIFALGVGVSPGWKKLYGDCGVVISRAVNLKSAMIRLVAMIQQLIYTA